MSPTARVVLGLALGAAIGLALAAFDPLRGNVTCDLTATSVVVRPSAREGA